MNDDSSRPAAPPTRLSALVERASHCRCGQQIFFRNNLCLACGTGLGYDPERASLMPLMPGHEPDTWQRWLPAQADPAVAQPQYRRCANLRTPAACNWLVPLESANESGTPPFCRACRLNRTIPALADPAFPDNGELWARIENAKRRLVSALIALGLPVASRVWEDPRHGLMFDFLRGTRDTGQIMTGHEDGLITLNVEEADDAVREAARKAMREPYRTLLGHLRHEVGHYYWDRLIDGTPWLERFRELFGDEREDYARSLRRHYEQGPKAGWQQRFVSAYASAHPWEDWAECWAHYLHMRDTVDTALNFGLDIESPQVDITAFGADALYRPADADAPRFLKLVNGWTRLSTLLNEMSHSMGQPDFYPFVLTRDAVAKLQFIHLVVTQSAAAARDRARDDDAARGKAASPA